MPQTRPKATLGLAIQLDPKQITYTPGDTIFGRVVRKVHTVGPRAWVTIRLYGRAKSKMTVHKNHGNYQSSKHYRGRFNFFSPNETCQKLFDGSVHIPPNGDPQEWPFALTIPTNPSPRWLGKSGK
jgi:hypothetical protein